MKSKKIIIAVIVGIVILCILVVGGLLVLGNSLNITTSGTSTVTVNGEETTTFSEVAYFNFVTENVSEFSDAIGEGITNLPKAEAQANLDSAEAILIEFKEENEAIDQVSGGNEVQDLRLAVAAYISGYEEVIVDFQEIIDTVDENGEVELQADADRINELLAESTAIQEVIVADINSSLDAVVSANEQ